MDATPAAIVGGAIAAHGFAAESHQAMLYIPMVALFAGLWLLVFNFLHADKIVDFISTPVMGGFISGIAVTIILMQIPKLWGALLLLILAKNRFPKFPMAILIMALGVLATMFFHVEEHGVILLSAVEPGLPRLFLPGSRGWI